MIYLYTECSVLAISAKSSKISTWMNETDVKALIWNVCSVGIRMEREESFFSRMLKGRLEIGLWMPGEGQKAISERKFTCFGAQPESNTRVQCAKSWPECGLCLINSRKINWIGCILEHHNPAESGLGFCILGEEIYDRGLNQVMTGIWEENVDKIGTLLLVSWCEESTRFGGQMGSLWIDFEVLEESAWGSFLKNLSRNRVLRPTQRFYWRSLAVLWWLGDWREVKLSHAKRHWAWGHWRRIIKVFGTLKHPPKCRKIHYFNEK